MKRRSNWPEALNDELDAAAKRSFGYGTPHDCCRFPNGVIRAMTGTDLMRGWRKYTTLDEAQELLGKQGQGSLVKTVISVLKFAGYKQISPAMAQRGDPVMAMVETVEGKAYVGGICIGAKAAFASDGLVYLPMAEVKRAWRYG